MTGVDAARVVLLAAAVAAPPSPSAKDPAAGLRRALGRAITHRGERRSLRLTVECQRNAGFSSVRVLGDGLGIWNDERQFRLGPDRLGTLLRALRDADFPGLDDSYGGAADPPPASLPRGGALVTKLTCHIELALGGYRKQVVQLAKGEQSSVLKKLAEDLLAACEPLARSGLGASSLDDGLEKLSTGELAPETWAVVAHRKPEEGGGGSGQAGFLLTIAGSRATSRAYAPASGHGEGLVLDLGPTEVRTLARELRSRNPSAWPANLHAPGYTDLSLRVLNHEKSVQARPFAGMRPGDRHEHQKAFEQALDILQRIHVRVLERGRRGPGPP